MFSRCSLRTLLGAGALSRRRSATDGTAAYRRHGDATERRWACALGVAALRGYSAAPADSSCWKCRRPLEGVPAFFCSVCEVVQPPDDAASYFQILGCDRAFTLDTQKLQQKYLQLQRKLHPDNFSRKSAEEQEYSEHHSALLNRAYRTLLKPLSRGLYMLELEGVAIEDGTDSGADPELLMELMDVNEALDEAQTSEEADGIGRNTKARLTELTEQIDAALRQGELGAAKALLVQMKYFANIEDKVKEKLSELL